MDLNVCTFHKAEKERNRKQNFGYTVEEKPWIFHEKHQLARCLKITEKVSFLTLRAKRATFTCQFLKLTVLKSQKLMENAKIRKFKCDFFGNFQTLWVSYFPFLHMPQTKNVTLMVNTNTFLQCLKSPKKSHLLIFQIWHFYQFSSF